MNCPKCQLPLELPTMSAETCAGTTDENIEVRIYCRRVLPTGTPNESRLCDGQLYHYIDLADFTPA